MTNMISISLLGMVILQHAWHVRSHLNKIKPWKKKVNGVFWSTILRMHNFLVSGCQKDPYTLLLLMYIAATVPSAPSAISNPGALGVVAAAVVSTAVDTVVGVGVNCGSTTTST